MFDLQDLLYNKKCNRDKLVAFGFVRDGALYRYERTVMEGQFRIVLAIRDDDGVEWDVIDCDSGDPYVLIRVPDACGGYVGALRTLCEALWTEIVERCWENKTFGERQSKRIVSHIADKYGDEPEFLWKDDLNAAIRRKDSRKWYAVLMTVSRRKLGFDSDEIVEALDLHATAQVTERLVDGVVFLPGYHMNKKYWYTVVLDDTADDETLFDRIAVSYDLAKK